MTWEETKIYIKKRVIILAAQGCFIFKQLRYVCFTSLSLLRSHDKVFLFVERNFFEKKRKKFPSSEDQSLTFSASSLQVRKPCESHQDREANG